MTKTTKQVVREYDQVVGNEVLRKREFEVTSYDTIQIPVTTKLYRCMITWNYKIEGERWLTEEEMIDIIKENSARDYYLVEPCETKELIIHYTTEEVAVAYHIETEDITLEYANELNALLDMDF